MMIFQLPLYIWSTMHGQNKNAKFHIVCLLILVTAVDPFTQHGQVITSIILWDDITYVFTNFNSLTVEVWEWMHDFPTHIL